MLSNVIERFNDNLRLVYHEFNIYEKKNVPSWILKQQQNEADRPADDHDREWGSILRIFSRQC